VDEALPKGAVQGGQQHEAQLVHKKVVGIRTRKDSGGSLKLMASVIPTYKPPPPYVSWAYLKRNELAQDAGKRMFYTDQTGETVPASDEEDESLPWEEKQGAAVDFAILEIAKEYDDDPEALEALAEKLKVSPDQVLMRLSHLRPRVITYDDRLGQEAEEMLEAHTGMFCRRCRIYSCRLHGGGHTRPHQRPAPPATSMNACGPHCWQLDPRTQQLMAQAEQQQEQRRQEGAGTDSGADGDSDKEEEEAATALTAQVGGRGANGSSGGAAPAAGTGRRVSGSGDGGSGDAGRAPASGGGPSGAVAASAGPSAAATAAAAASAGLKRPRGRSEEREMRGASSAAATSAAAAVSSSTGGAALNADGADGPTSNWSTHEQSLFDKAYMAFGLDCCGIARVLGTRSCAEVAVQVASLKATGRLELHDTNVQGRRSRNLKKLKKNSFAAPVPKKSAVVMKRYNHSVDEAWEEYAPCGCQGPSCNSDCRCMQSKNFCEKFCACSNRCINRFRGCKCMGGCKNRACPCLAAGRECDPDLCRACAATCEGTAPPGCECHNMRLRLRQHMRIIMAHSEVAGWGAFSLQECRKDEFLGEYTGDLITQDEADRRGRIYDRIDNSYLFNLNEQWVLDARHRGNKLRFANHSNDPNCKARIMLVDGDHRVAIFANKNIEAGEELFYDYRYDRDQAPDWAQKD